MTESENNNCQSARSVEIAMMDRRESQIPPLADSAFAKAYRQTLARTESVVAREGSAIVRVFSNGESFFLKEIDPPIAVQKGRVICRRDASVAHE